jgi:hypothetical protein
MATIDTVKKTGINALNFDFEFPVKVLYVHAALVSSAVVGNRQVEMEEFLAAADATSHLFHAAAGAVQAASLTRHYNFGQGFQQPTAFVSGTIEHPMPVLTLPAGGRVRVFDSANIDAAGDALMVFVQIERL